VGKSDIKRETSGQAVRKRQRENPRDILDGNQRTKDRKIDRPT
jgi:hypothetical protein